MQIIQQRQRHEEIEHRLGFESVQHPGCGFSFGCDEAGVVDVEALNPDARANYDKCIAGHDPDRDEDIRKVGIQKYDNSWVEPAIGLCDCGENVDLDGFTNTCEGCGADYNSSGQRLANRSQWGEETGEHIADILRIP